MIYVASPYTSNLVGDLARQAEHRRFEQVLAFTTGLIARGEIVFSPIVYFHPVAMIAKLPTDFEFWYKQNTQYLRRAEALFVLRLPGWDQSKGVQQEIKLAKILGLQRVDFAEDFKRVQ